MQYHLNEKQQKAVEHKNGPLLIIAGAGTGKTAVITNRIVNIIKSEWAKPSEILALTFTEKAAMEMRDRVDLEMPIGYEEISISTFHSFCDKLLRQEGSYIGIDTNYTLMTQAQSYLLFRKNLFEFKLKKFRSFGNPTAFIADILKHFSRLQDEDVTPQQYKEFIETLPKNTAEEKEYYEELTEIVGAFEDFMKLKLKESKLDFGDLITLAIKLLREKPNILAKYRRRYKYILVDEYQDTNYTQNELVNIIALGLKPTKEDRKKANLTVVGDDDQAIYKFRGAAISNILHFNETYPDHENIVLTENYRSRQEILDGAYRLISNNNPYRLEITEKVNKKLIAKGEFEPSTEDPIQLITTSKGSEEAEKVAKEILKLTGKVEDSLNQTGVYDSKGQAAFLDMESLQASEASGEKGQYRFSDIAILVRANDHSEEFVNNLRYYGIPYKFMGRKGLYSRPEVSPLISFLRVLADDSKDVDMFNLLRMDIWELSGREIVEIMRFARQNRESYLRTLETLWGIKLGTGNYDVAQRRENLIKNMLSQKSVASISNLLEVFDKAYSALKKGSKLGELLFLFFKESGYLDSLQSEESIENDFKIKNISKYFETVKSYEEDAENAGLIEYLDYLKFSLDLGETPNVEEDSLAEYDAVNIMTVHGAKGLEFPVVFLVNLANERFPSRAMSDRIPIPDGIIKEQLSGKDPHEEHIQEERRLFYVGMTRAKERLYLTAANYYSGGKRARKLSGFLSEALEKEVTIENVTKNEGKEGEEIDSETVGISTMGSPQFAITYSDADDLIKFNGLQVNYLTRASYTQLSSFEKCPKQYRYKYILSIPGAVSFTQTFGRTIHNALRDFYEMQKMYNEGLAGFSKKPELADLLEAYGRRWSGEGFESKLQENKRKKSGIEVLTNYYNKIHRGDEKTMEVERRFNYRLNDTNLTGSIDRIDYLEKKDGFDYVEIIDYKTGKVKKEDEVENDLQLSLYTIALEASDPKIRVQKASLYYVEHCEMISANIEQENKEKVKERISDMISEIRKGKFISQPGFLCSFCDYNTICSEAKV